MADKESSPTASGEAVNGTLGKVNAIHIDPKVLRDRHYENQYTRNPMDFDVVMMSLDHHYEGQATRRVAPSRDEKPIDVKAVTSEGLPGPDTKWKFIEHYSLVGHGDGNDLVLTHAEVYKPNVLDPKKYNDAPPEPDGDDLISIKNIRLKGVTSYNAAANANVVDQQKLARALQSNWKEAIANTKDAYVKHEKAARAAAGVQVDNSQSGLLQLPAMPPATQRSAQAKSKEPYRRS